MRIVKLEFFQYHLLAEACQLLQSLYPRSFQCYDDYVSLIQTHSSRNLYQYFIELPKKDQTQRLKQRLIIVSLKEPLHNLVGPFYALDLEVETFYLWVEISEVKFSWDLLLKDRRL
jgi:hypothetical protein